MSLATQRKKRARPPLVVESKKLYYIREMFCWCGTASLDGRDHKDGCGYKNLTKGSRPRALKEDETLDLSSLSTGWMQPR